MGGEREIITDREDGSVEGMMGEYSEWKEDDCPCPRCGEFSVKWRLWESSDGGHEDVNYHCECGHDWWVDGCDS